MHRFFFVTGLATLGEFWTGCIGGDRVFIRNQFYPAISCELEGDPVFTACSEDSDEC